MAREVSLAELGDQLRTVQKLIDDCMASDDETPELEFAAVRKPLQAALDLLGSEKTATAADSARRKWNPDLAVAAVFPANAHEQRNRTA